jgi:hypothetical protein
VAQGDWVSHQTTLTFFGVPYYLSIADGKLSFTGSSFAAAWQGAFVRRPATVVRGGMRVTTQVRNPTGAPAYLIICGATDWSSYVAVAIQNVAVGLSTGAGWANMVGRVYQPATITDRDYVSVDWVSGTDSYDIYRHTTPDVPAGAEPIFTWVDEAHVVLHGGAYQYNGAMLSITGFVPSASLEDFGFKDVVAVPPPITPAGATLPYHLPVRLGLPPGGDLAPAALLQYFAPTPVVRERVTATIGVLRLTALGPALSTDPPEPPHGVIALTAPTPDVRERVTAPMGVLTLSAPAPTTAVPSLFSETFDNLAAWTLTGTNASTLIQAASGRLNLGGPTSSGTECHARTTSSYNVTGKSVRMEIVSAGVSSHYDAFGVTDATGAYYARWLIYLDGYLYPQTSAGNLTVGLLYNPTNHKFLRVRELSGSTYFDYSADGLSWTNYGGPAPTYYTPSTAYVRFTYAANAAATTVYDNVIIS